MQRATPVGRSPTKAAAADAILPPDAVLLMDRESRLGVWGRVGPAAGGVVVDMVVELVPVTPRGVRSSGGGGKRAGSTNGGASGTSQRMRPTGWRRSAATRLPSAAPPRLSPSGYNRGAAAHPLHASTVGSRLWASREQRRRYTRVPMHRDEVQWHKGNNIQKKLPPVGWSYHSNPRPSDY